MKYLQVQAYIHMGSTLRAIADSILALYSQITKVITVGSFAP